MDMMGWVALGTTALVLLLFTLLWLREVRIVSREKIGTGNWMNGAGFGLLPALTAWKIFEPYLGIHAMSAGKQVFDPFGAIPVITRDGYFVPERIELIAAIVSFLFVLIWLICRKELLPGNGDLLLTVICIWSAIRTASETLRGAPLRVAGISVMIVLYTALEIAVMTVWTIRRGRKQKNAAMTAVEWLAFLGCCTVIILQDAEVLSMGSRIANLVVSIGCSILNAVLILSAGKDSREE